MVAGFFGAFGSLGGSSESLARPVRISVHSAHQDKAVELALALLGCRFARRDERAKREAAVGRNGKDVVAQVGAILESDGISVGLHYEVKREQAIKVEVD